MPTHLLRSYPDRRTAWRASGFLVDEGVLARPQDVAEGRRTLPGLTSGPIRHWVTVAFASDLEHAAALLDLFDAAPPEPEEDADPGPEPDLTRLPRDLPIPCERCRHDLRAFVGADPGVRCPACGHDNDAVERVLTRHGPEALIDCYPDDDPEDPERTEDAQLARLNLPCPHCACPLHALGVTGDCPACGKPYDKRAIARHAFDAL